MYLDHETGRLVVSPSDLIGYLACEHLTHLSIEVAEGLRNRPIDDDEGVAVIQRRGIEHEQVYLAALTAQDASVIDIGEGPLASRALETTRVLAEGPDVIYQATFLDDRVAGPIWRGHADFLTRVEIPSALGPFSYEPEDTKLAHEVRPSAVLQLCEYAEQLENVQGIPPEHIHVVLGGQRRLTLRLDEFTAYFRSVKHEFIDALATSFTTYPNPVEHCAVCSWRQNCDKQRVADDHLSLVAGLTREQARILTNQAGVSTMTELAHYEGLSVRGIGTPTFERLRAQARLQIRAHEGGEARPPYELLADASTGFALGALPEPTPYDLFFDIEGDPFVGDGGLEYLLGVSWSDGNGGYDYRSFWAHTHEEEKTSFEEFIDFVCERRSIHPDLHVYHYAAYERTALGRLMGRHGTREQEVDALFRGRALVDLYQVVRQAVRVGTPSYSLKKLEALYLEKRTEEITDAGSSIVEYERFLETGYGSILQALRDYNEVDCNSTAGLRNWLEERRNDFFKQFGTEPERPPTAADEPTAAVTEEATENEALRRALTMQPESTEGEEVRHARSLLGDLLEWHRREALPEWWGFYHRVFDCDDQDLFHDAEAIAGLEYIGEGETIKRSVIHRYRFDPAQDFKIAEGSQPCDPARERTARTEGAQLPGPRRIYYLDSEIGELGLLRGINSSAPHPQSLIPSGPIETSNQREALRRLARVVIANGIDSVDSPYRAARDLLLRRLPRTNRFDHVGELLGPHEHATDGAIRIAMQLEGGCLAIQGPPGSGKTSTAAKVAVALVKQGKQVGITANSHAVIGNLLCAILAEADRQGEVIRISQRADPFQGVDDPAVDVRSTPTAVLQDIKDGCNIIAGTPWLFSRSEFEDSINCLIVDEAGQLSLANTLAVALAAKNLILVGDPRQLSQPSKGTHPNGAAASALEHLLNGADTMPDTLGLFLEVSHRLHPDICRFISELSYEGRLSADDQCAKQSIGGNDMLSGSGLRWIPVGHEGNRVSSPEEVEVVQSLFGELLDRPFTNQSGQSRPISSADILVIAPYNAQVTSLVHALPKGSRVGTVDKFQGQEAPIVIFSLATSDLSEIPRGMDFLYSRNRLNVAISRAQALALVVGCPQLLHVRCHTVEELRLANGLCRFVELAKLVPSSWAQDSRVAESVWSSSFDWRQQTSSSYQFPNNFRDKFSK